jgi:hypothetical protein
MSLNITKTNSVCHISKFIDHIDGLSSNSSSPTDTWVLYFKDGVTYESIPIKTGFLKFFISPKDFRPEPDKLLALNYEIKIYSKVIHPLIENNICPNFVKYLASGVKCDYKNIIDMIKDKLYNEGKLLNKNSYEYNFRRNLKYMFEELKGRPSINNPINDVDVDDMKDYFKKFSYNMILNETTENSITLAQWIKKTDLPDYNIEIWNIIFQISIACYSMFLSKLIHNDLHYGNIFIKNIGEKKYFIYYINGNPIIIKTQYQALIYDFDRSYCKRLGKNNYLDVFCEDYSQCNKVVEPKDLIKIMCNVYRFVDKTLKDNIINMFSSDIETQKLLKDSYFLDCFMNYKEDPTPSGREVIKSHPDSWYLNFNNYTEIIKLIKTKHLQEFDLETVLKTIDKNNIYYCNKNYFNSEGIIDKKKLGIEKLIIEDKHFI